MKLSNLITIFILFFILTLGLFLRKDNLYTWPRLGATFDEYAWTWVGINLIKNQVPESWSPHPQYKSYKNVIYQKTYFRVVKPWLEHPPLFGLVAGSYAILNGANDMFDVDLLKIRGLALILGALSIFLIFVLAADLYGTSIGLLSALLYATIPTVVVGSRIVQNENFFIPCFLLALFFISKYIKTKKSLFRNSSAVICGLLILAKIPWIAATLAIVMILMYVKRYKDIFKFLLIVIPITALYFVYGFYFDANLFMNLWKLQLNRYDIAFNSIFALFTESYLVDRFMIDGWIYFGWVAMFLLLIKDVKKHLFIAFPFLAYFVIFVAGIPNEAGHGWYRYPFYPFLIIAIALFIKEHFVKNWILTFIFLILVGTGILGLTWEKTFGFSYVVFRLFLVGWGISLIPLFVHLKRLPKFFKVINYGWLVVFFLMNIWAVLLYNEQ